MLVKLEICLLFFGVGYGNEWIFKLEVYFDYMVSEYCSMLEFCNFYGFIFQKMGDFQFVDCVEKLIYNVMFGVCNSNGLVIIYSKFDNCYIMDGKYYEEGEIRDDLWYKYFFIYFEFVVCCMLNYG